MLSFSQGFGGTGLVARPKYPYRETGVVIPLSHCVFCGVADYWCYTPTSFRKKWPIASQRRALDGGHRRKNLPLKPVAQEGASHEVVSPIALLIVGH